PPVADRRLPDEVAAQIEALFGLLQPTDFSADLRQTLEACYAAGDTHGLAFGRWVSRVFSKHGLVIAGSNDEEAKRRLAEAMQTSVAKSGEILKALEAQSQSA